jgi:hypothetical protein
MIKLRAVDQPESKIEDFFADVLKGWREDAGEPQVCIVIGLNKINGNQMVGYRIHPVGLFPTEFFGILELAKVGFISNQGHDE